VDDVDPQDLERVLRGHYIVGEVATSLNNVGDNPGGTELVSERPFIVLMGDLALHQGFDTAYMRDEHNGEQQRMARRCHLIPSPACKKWYPERDTAARCPGNFVAMGVEFHDEFDTWMIDDKPTPMFGLRFAGVAGDARAAGTSRNPGASRTPVHVDIVFFTHDGNYHALHAHHINGVPRKTVRISMDPEDPGIFKECMDWKFCESLALARRMTTGSVGGGNRMPHDFGIDATLLRGLNSREADELRRSARLIA
jgi:hypothetical protein